MPKAPEYVPVNPFLAEKLANFFEDIVAIKDDLYFHPHPLTYDMAERIAIYEGDDLYFLQIKDNGVVGYAMLRGWDEGFTIPSLGIAIHPNFRNRGLAKEFMAFLHNQARAKGATKLRIKVYANNVGAKQLYESLGYLFADEENGQFIGYCDL